MLSMDTNRASWNVSLKTDDRIMRTFSVVGRRFSVDESRSRVGPGERETAAHEKGNSLRIQVLGRSIINCKLRRAMSCRSTLQHQKTLHCGWLSKTGGQWPRTIKRRWFEIKGDQLYYFRSKGDSKPIAGIPLAGNRVERRTGDGTHQFQFEIVSGEQRIGKPVTDTHESYLFIASSQKDLEQWMKAINIIIYTPFGGGMFGRSIEDTVKVDSRRGGGMVPIIIEKCVEYVRNYEPLEEGVFRLSGNVQEVDDLLNRFNKGEIVDLVSERHGIHTIASLLKAYLRSLPEPVIPFSFYDKCTSIVCTYNDDRDTEVEKLSIVLKSISKASLNTLKYISRFLHEFQGHQQVTKMTLANLAVVFGPNVLSPNSENPQVLMESSSMIAQSMEFFIKNHANLFPQTDDEKYYNPRSPDATPPKSHRQVSSSPSFSFDMESTDVSSKSDTVRKSATFPRFSRLGSLSNSLAGASLNGLSESEEGQDYETQVNELALELELQRSQFEVQVQELENQLDVQNKIIAMLKIRLHEEHKARTSAEKRLELYRLGIQEYCQKFGHVDISIP
ncbi:rho GTPase-activating protein 24-like isoform X1 [Rhopilema esculentum]|uniref:rho GTPase-activating protein 24-like isoform X1 n=1 Tax=Rhopilema esculentum TaxID=499914 RepID=UPI0031D938B2